MERVFLDKFIKGGIIVSEESIDENNEFKEDDTIKKPTIQSLFDSDLLLLLIILFVFFENDDRFYDYFDLLNNNLSQMKTYVETAEAALQGLEQTSKIPKQMLN